MVIPFLIVAGLGAAGVFAALREPSKAATPPPNSGNSAPPTQPPPSSMFVNTPATYDPALLGRASGGSSSSDPAKIVSGSKVDSPKGILEIAGKAAGYIGEQVADTEAAKAAAAPIGLGLAAATYIGLQTGLITVISGSVAMGAMASAGFMAVAVVVIAVNIVALVDQILIAFKTGDFDKLCRQVALKREAGDYRAAQALWVEGVKKIGSPAATVGGVSANFKYPGYAQQAALAAAGSDAMKRAQKALALYPGWPNMPASASAEEIRLHPDQLPFSIPLKNGKELEIVKTLDLLTQDAIDVRTWALANGVPGVTVSAGKLITVTTGDRDVRGFEAYGNLRKLLDDWARVFEEQIQWVQYGALQRQFPETPAETAVREFNAAAVAAQQFAAVQARNGVPTTSTAKSTILPLPPPKPASAPPPTASAASTANEDNGVVSTSGAAPNASNVDSKQGLGKQKSGTYLAEL